MKRVLILMLLCISCNTKSKQEKFCLQKIWYHSQKGVLAPSIIKIKIGDNNDVISKKIESGKLTNIILYSIKKEDRGFFLKWDKFKKDKNSTTIEVITSFFDSERIHKWTTKEIEKAITGDVGLVFDKDTVVIKKCD